MTITWISFAICTIIYIIIVVATAQSHKNISIGIGICTGAVLFAWFCVNIYNSQQSY